LDDIYLRIGVGDDDDDDATVERRSRDSNELKGTPTKAAAAEVALLLLVRNNVAIQKASHSVHYTYNTYMYTHSFPGIIK
jgi:hypothetical protein